MRAEAIQCGKCRAPVPAEFFNRGSFSPCPACGTLLEVEVFPAFHRSLPAVAAAEAVLTDEEASCFFHPEKKAAVPCEACGRFLCLLCDCEIGGQHLCPTCLETGKKKGRIKSLENRRVLYDKIALALAVYPMLLFYLTIFTAPMAIFVAIRYWKAPASILPRTRVRSVIAIVLALLQIAGWIALFTFLIRGLSR